MTVPLIYFMQELTDPGSWNIEETIANISKLDPSLAGHVEAFRTHEIDGKLFYQCGDFTNIMKTTFLYTF